MMWGFSHDFIIDNKHAWVGITMPGCVDGLKNFNPTRYAELSFKNPSAMPCLGAPNSTVAPSEEGLR